jgi:hypothetical protein
MDGGSRRIFALEIDAGANPITGRVGEEGTASEPFVGWLGLARALEQLLGDNRRRDDPPKMGTPGPSGER